jgi:SAM-dependent methyltransferase
MIPMQGKVLDLACGTGRHIRFLTDMGADVVAVDRDISLLGDLARLMAVEAIEADLEIGKWPLPDRVFAGIVVTNYLHRPLFPILLSSLIPGGVLIYETFSQGNEKFGKPSNPDFLLHPGELLKVVEGQARVLAYEDLIVNEPKPAAVQRICAIRI